MVNNPHFDLPFRFGPNKSVATTEQAGRKDITNGVEAALRTERGSRFYVPQFGISDPTFQNYPIKTDQILAEISDSEPRAQVLFEQTFRDMVDNLIAGVVAGGE